MLDPRKPLPTRFRALFALEGKGGDRCSEAIQKALESEGSTLLRHELAYALGQMRSEKAVEKLASILEDEGEEAIVRHEAAEALGAIGTKECLPPLKAHVHSDIKEVRETCELALKRIESGKDAGGVRGSDGTKKERLAHEHVSGEEPFLSVDPVPAWSSDTPQHLAEETLLDDSQSPWERYGAMFLLRNRGGERSARALASALGTSDSALLKHEVAYVLGQLQEVGSGAQEALMESLRNRREHPMVRHEAAEALGSLGVEGTRSLLERFRHDPQPVVADSCRVALDMIDDCE